MMVFILAQNAGCYRPGGHGFKPWKQPLAEMQGLNDIRLCLHSEIPLYGTERLVQELTKFVIDTHNIIINQVFFNEEVVDSKLLKARMRMQQKYLDQFYMLYDDFNITKLPLLPREVCGVEALKAFSHIFLTLYQPSLVRGLVEELEIRIVTVKEQLKDAEEELAKLRAGQQESIM
ncbi:ATPase ASNA1 -like protein [Capsicum annuum]|nr:ATPase ASNA1 -like protein [Capsicum annuum]KAF3676910.1 ATPase ASNA1 -like protein [Capsicum annuum]